MNWKRITCLALAFVLLCGALTACGSDGYGKYNDLTANQDGSVTIQTEGVTADARFFNYDADGVTVQLVALRDEDDGVHVAFNTCQNCSPSPKAYYTQGDGVLRCTNCGFTFAPEEVGIAQNGCNPWPVEGIEIGAEEITIPVASLEEMNPLFAGWKGPTK
ncbi:MAG: DUF2318 domain-containing protein [Oscillospiraceae bacterium]|nr:DUF2318 domain-containing protein [Oscillospiraceae bacterium]